MFFIIALLVIFGGIYWKLYSTNGDFTPQERYLEPWEEDTQTVIYIQPREGIPLPNA